RNGGHDLKTSGCQVLDLAGNGHSPAIDLAQKIRHVIGDDVDNMKLKCLRGGEADCCTHGFGCPFRIAAVEFRKAADIGHGIVDELTRFSVGRRGDGGGAVVCASLVLAVL